MKYLILLLLPFTVMADNWRHHDHDPVVKNYFSTTNVTEVNEYNQAAADESAGIALAIATWHPFDFGTDTAQWSINTSRYDGYSIQEAISAGIAQRFRFGKSKVMLYASYGQNINNINNGLCVFQKKDNSDCSYAVTAGVQGRF